MSYGKHSSPHAVASGLIGFVALVGSASVSFGNTDLAAGAGWPPSPRVSVTKVSEAGSIKSVCVSYATPHIKKFRFNQTHVNFGLPNALASYWFWCSGWQDLLSFGDLPGPFGWFPNLSSGNDTGRWADKIVSWHASNISENHVRHTRLWWWF